MLSSSYSEVTYFMYCTAYVQLNDAFNLLLIWFQVIPICVRWIVTVGHALLALTLQWLNADVATWIVK